MSLPRERCTGKLIVHSMAYYMNKKQKTEIKRNVLFLVTCSTYKKLLQFIKRIATNVGRRMLSFVMQGNPCTCRHTGMHRVFSFRLKSLHCPAFGVYLVHGQQWCIHQTFLANHQSTSQCILPKASSITCAMFSFHQLAVNGEKNYKSSELLTFVWCRNMLHLTIHSNFTTSTLHHLSYLH